MSDEPNTAAPATPPAPEPAEISTEDLSQVSGGLGVPIERPRSITEANGVATDVSAAFRSRPE
jgi:hypothetical protein